MSTNNDTIILGQRLLAHDPSCTLTFMSITLLRNVIVTQVGSLFRSLAGLRLGSSGCDSLIGGTTTAIGSSTTSRSIGISISAGNAWYVGATGVGFK